MNVVIVGGHGHVAMRLARLLSAKPNTKVVSIFRNAAHSEEVAATGATPLVLSLEDDPAAKFAEAFEGKDLVYFTAGAGMDGYPERTLKVDRDGALKVFDALEQVKGTKPRLILLSSIDVRDPNAPPPAHYTEADIKTSEGGYKAIGQYFKAKYDADKSLVARTSFKWTILRPDWLTNEPGTGLVTVGRVHLGSPISRDDVAKALFLLADRPDAAGLTIEINSGSVKIEEALEAFIKKGETDFLG